jgi:hypothetical protein
MNAVVVDRRDTQEILRTTFYNRIRKGFNPLSEVDEVFREYNDIISNHPWRTKDCLATRAEVIEAAEWAIAEKRKQCL